MLPPVNSSSQPFRFVSLAADDQRRLGALIQSSKQNEAEPAWMEKLRTASAEQRKPRRWQLKVAGAVGLFVIGLASVAYLLHFGLLK